MHLHENTPQNGKITGGMLVMIYVFVFFSGFANLATEIIGPRLFASLFGSTTLVWAAIISVTLLGISIGYYAGGRVPRHRILLVIPVILLVNALWLLGISWLIWKVPRVLLQWGFASILLVASLAFVVPAMLFSMASPLSITLLSENRPPEWISRMVGNILAIGTVGSILGALLAAFYLIPWVGLTASLRLFAVLSVLFSLYFFSNKRRPAALLMLAVCGIFPQPAYQWVTDRTLLEQREGYYQTIRVYSDENNMYFHLGPTYESVVNLRTGQPGLSYAREMLALMDDVSGSTILIIGGAGHTLARALEARGAAVTEVEIDPLVVQVSDTHFGSIRGDVVIQDGRTYMDWVEKNRFDYVILDAFNGVHYIPPQLVTYEFFKTSSYVLKPDGRLLINFIGTPSGPRSNSFHALSATLSKIFVDVRASHTGGDAMRNIVFVASQRVMPEIAYENVPTDGRVLTDDLNPIEIFLLQARDNQVFYRRVIE